MDENAHGNSTLRTDGQTDGQTDGRLTIEIPRDVHRAVKTRLKYSSAILATEMEMGHLS